MLEQKKRAFWDERAAGDNPGSNDFTLKRLEMKLILERIPKSSRILEVGSGAGEALVALAKEKNCTGVGIDFSEAMVRRARVYAKKNRCDKKVRFEVGKTPDLPSHLGTFDFVLTERCLVNLNSRDAQKKAFIELMSHLKSGGQYLMIEDFQDGLDNTNAFRKMLKLYRIDPPWHNIFLTQKQIDSWESSSHILKEVIPFSSTYYFLSRVVYAGLERDVRKLKYDSEINLLSCKLAPVGDFGATKAWLWKRK
ncbi:MAG TPA: class I SAM-dependent methyltransferase [Candidatus Paceibacterota bacterium]|nr:class I SAM-dependent methyltransferase [Candidatus Paceibacterota bacterium]